MDEPLGAPWTILDNYRRKMASYVDDLSPAQLANYDEYITDRKQLLETGYGLDLTNEFELYGLVCGIVRVLAEIHMLSKAAIPTEDYSAYKPLLDAIARTCGVLVHGVLANHPDVPEPG